MKIGLYGGTFSPPHLGHIRAAQCFVKGAELDKLIIMPAGIPPHKVVLILYQAKKDLKWLRSLFRE